MVFEAAHNASWPSIDCMNAPSPRDICRSAGSGFSGRGPFDDICFRALDDGKDFRPFGGGNVEGIQSSVCEFSDLSIGDREIRGSGSI